MSPEINHLIYSSKKEMERSQAFVDELIRLSSMPINKGEPESVMVYGIHTIVQGQITLSRILLAILEAQSEIIDAQKKS